MNEETPSEAQREAYQEASKREFFDRWLLPNRRNVWHIASYKIAFDCAEDLEDRIQALTTAINKASRSSNIVRYGS